MKNLFLKTLGILAFSTTALAEGHMGPGTSGEAIPIENDRLYTPLDLQRVAYLCDLQEFKKIGAQLLKKRPDEVGIVALVSKIFDGELPEDGIRSANEFNNTHIEGTEFNLYQFIESQNQTRVEQSSDRPRNFFKLQKPRDNEDQPPTDSYRAEFEAWKIAFKKALPNALTRALLSDEPLKAIRSTAAARLIITDYSETLSQLVLNLGRVEGFAIFDRSLMYENIIPLVSLGAISVTDVSDRSSIIHRSSLTPEFSKVSYVQISRNAFDDQQIEIDVNTPEDNFKHIKIPLRLIPQGTQPDRTSDYQDSFLNWPTIGLSSNQSHEVKDQTWGELQDLLSTQYFYRNLSILPASSSQVELYNTDTEKYVESQSGERITFSTQGYIDCLKAKL